MRTYRSFEEIDHDLSILKLERNIALEKIKLHLTTTKNELKLLTLLSKKGGGFLKNMVVALLLKKIFK